MLCKYHCSGIIRKRGQSFWFELQVWVVGCVEGIYSGLRVRCLIPLQVAVLEIFRSRILFLVTAATAWQLVALTHYSGRSGIKNGCTNKTAKEVFIFAIFHKKNQHLNSSRRRQANVTLLVSMQSSLIIRSRLTSRELLTACKDVVVTSELRGRNCGRKGGSMRHGR